MVARWRAERRRCPTAISSPITRSIRTFLIVRFFVFSLQKTSAHFCLSDSLNASYTTSGAGGTLNDSSYAGGSLRTTLRTSLPDLNKPVKTYPIEQLETHNKKLPDGVDRQHLERHLGLDDFERLFEMTPIEFYKLPEWKRINLKRKYKLF